MGMVKGLNVAKHQCYDCLWLINSKESIDKLYQFASLENDIEDMAYLGKLYLNGKGIKKSRKKGLCLLKKASENGLKWASIIYYDELYKDPKSDITEISRIIEQLAISGYTPAMYRLGKAYYEGRGFSKDLDKSLFYLEKVQNYNNETYVNVLIDMGTEDSLNIASNIIQNRMSPDIKVKYCKFIH